MLRGGYLRAKTMLAALETREKWMVLGGGGILVCFLAILGIFHERILHWLVGVSQNFKTIPHGWIILVLLICIISFPPLIGYSVVSMFTGMVYGFPAGWPVLAAGTLFGSFASFLVFRYVLKERATALAKSNIKFMAFAKTLEQDRLMLLWLIRLCPLPYSLSNAALSSVPTVEPWAFFFATALTTPKLFIHIFIGDRVARLGSTQDTSTKVVNLVSIVIAMSTAVIASYVIYNRTMQRVAELDRAGDYSEVNDMSDFEIDEDSADERDPFPLEDSTNGSTVDLSRGA